MATPVYTSGTAIKFKTSDGIEHSCDKWEAEWEVGEPDVTNSRSSSAGGIKLQQLLVGVGKARITISGPKDESGDDAWTLGQDITVHLYWTSLLFVKFSGIVGRFRGSQDVKDAGRFQLTVDTTGDTFSVGFDGAAA